MRRYTITLKADVMKRMSPLHRHSGARIAVEMDIHFEILYNSRTAWNL